MTDEELRDELVTLLLAGHETTATSVAWAIERLVRHPQKLSAAGRGDRRRRRDGGGDEYMTAVVNETLRVRPVGAGRGAHADAGAASWAATALPAGTRVVPSIYLTNRNPRVYEQPRRVPPGALPRRVRPRRSRGFRSAAASAAASARRSRSWRCADAANDARRARAARAAAGGAWRTRRADPPARDHARAGGRRGGRVGARACRGLLMRAAVGRPVRAFALSGPGLRSARARRRGRGEG